MRKEHFIGTTLKGGYSVEKILGEGAFGTTYLARRENKTPFAIKIFDETSDPLKLAELVQEALVIAQLRHQNIIPFHKFDIQERRVRDEHEKETIEYFPFLVMGYANEGSLRRLKATKSTTPLKPDQVIHILAQAASGVQFAHDVRPNPVIHRDLKPENILLHREKPITPHFDVFIGDFGIAIAAHSETSLEPQKASGTLPYMAPEQLNGRAIIASDQFALGVIAYELLTGKRPFAGIERDKPLSFLEILKQTGNEKHMDTVLEYLEEGVMTALAKNPKERYPSVREFAQALKEAHVKGVEVEERQRSIFEATTHHQLDVTSTLSTSEVKSNELVKRGKKLAQEAKDKKALRAFDEALRYNPNNADAYYQKGYLLFDRYRHDEALRAFDKALRLDPNNADAHYLRGRVLWFGFERYEEALCAFDEALQLDPDNAQAYFHKGMLLSGYLGRHEEALSALDEALRLDPNIEDFNNVKNAVLRRVEHIRNKPI